MSRYVETEHTEEHLMGASQPGHSKLHSVTRKNRQLYHLAISSPASYTSNCVIRSAEFREVGYRSFVELVFILILEVPSSI